MLFIYSSALLSLPSTSHQHDSSLTMARTKRLAILGHTNVITCNIANDMQDNLFANTIKYSKLITPRF